MRVQISAHTAKGLLATLLLEDCDQLMAAVAQLTKQNLISARPAAMQLTALLYLD